MNHAQQYRADIDGLRGIAVLAVVVFHAFPGVLPGGFVGVDVFFVISGFLISSLVLAAVHEHRFSVVEFYGRRIRRLFPALVAVLAASLGAGWYLLSTNAFAQMGGHTAAAAAFIANLVSWREAGYFDAAAEARPLLHLWSLGVEEQFYLTWPLLLAGAARWGRALVPITLGLVLLSFAANVALVRGDAAAAFYLPHTRAWELLAGALLAMMVRTRGPVGAGWLSGVGLALIVATAVAIGEGTAFPGWWALAPVLGACLIIAAPPDTRVNEWLSNRALVWIGLVSYPLYLWHWPLLSFARLSMATPPSAPFVLGLVALAVVLAWVTHVLLEQPIRVGRWRHSSAAVAMLVVGAAGVGVAGAAAAEGRLGVRSSRFDRILARTFDYERAYRGGRCQLGAGQTAADFSTACVDADFGSAATSVVIWGDSHAAHLYPGMAALAAEQVSLAQFTADGCPPLDGEASAFCRGINAFVQERLPSLEADVIVMAADWTRPKVERLVASVAAVRRVTAAPIVIVGPAPRWHTALPQQLVVFSQRHPALPAPERLRDGLNNDGFELDAVMRALQFDAGVRYVSATDALCDEGGCLAVIGDEVTAFDDVHLTDAGSRVVAAAVLAEVARLR